jgi:hypothetical protein
MGFFGAGSALGELSPDRPPRRPADNRRARRDRQLGRSYLARCLRRGTSLPWHARRWPPVRHFDVVPILRLRRERGAQSARWAAGVKVVSLTGTPEEQWTVTAGQQGNRAQRRNRPTRAGLARCGRPEKAIQRRAAEACVALRSRIHLSGHPTHAP